MARRPVGEGATCTIRAHVGEAWRRWQGRPASGKAREAAARGAGGTGCRIGQRQRCRRRTVPHRTERASRCRPADGAGSGRMSVAPVDGPRRGEDPMKDSPDAIGLRVQERYPPIGDYGLIGDGRSAALVSRAGSIAWWCVPRFDGDPIFGSLLDAELGGSFVIRPVEPFRTRRRYVGQTALLETEFTTAGGVVRVVDFMPAATERQKRTYPVPFRSIVRRVTGLRGRVRLRVQLRVRPHYGTHAPRLE